ncbi:MAG TPA: VOC family protein [Galbitalea sp.]|jgi:methylmalonyl-CoA/ethylmalonyl-CoA epimerase
MELVQVAQHVEDLDRAVAFYENLLGTKAAGVYSPPGIAFFNLDGTRLLLDSKASTTRISLAVDDVEFSLDELIKSGVVVEEEPHVIWQHRDDTLGPAGTDEWAATITDSEGNSVTLVSYANTDPND